MVVALTQVSAANPMADIGGTSELHGQGGKGLLLAGPLASFRS